MKGIVLKFHLRSDGRVLTIPVVSHLYSNRNKKANPKRVSDEECTFYINDEMMSSRYCD